MIILSILFFVTAIFYSSVGFGGGSTYLALLLIWNVPFYIFPIIALSCNIIVVSGNCFNYIRAGNLNFKLLTPYLIGSIPLAFVGGALQIEKELFEILLFLVLTTAGLLLLFKFKSYDDKEENFKKIPVFVSILIGGILGFISGIVGIGGGIFLSPILFLIRAGNLNFKLLTPYLIGSIPLAFIGGTLPVEKELFEILLFLVLTTAGLLLLFKFKSYDDKEENFKKIPVFFSILIGGILGFISGIVGIGGGIFLSPILFLVRAGKAKHIVTTASLFILINCISGIIGQLTKNLVLSEIHNYWYLLIAVLVGGQIGNFLNLKILPTRILALLTSLLVLFVSVRMGVKLFY